MKISGTAILLSYDTNDIFYCYHTRIYPIKYMPYLLKLGIISLIYGEKTKKNENRKKPRYKDKKSNKRYCIVLQQIAAFQCQLYDVYLGTPT